MNAYKLVFHEDFSYEGALKTDDWNIEVGHKWANNEKQCYTDDLKNCYVKDGALHIVSTLHEDQGCKYQSARINTKDKHMWQYGKFEVRAKMPKGRGSWPAIWFLGSNLGKEAKWPLCGEIDLMEFAGNRPDIVYGSLHSQTYNHKHNTERTVTTVLPTVSEQFHTYEVEWTQFSISFKIDGDVYASYEKALDDTVAEWPFDQPFYLIINLAVGGMFGGEISDEDFPYVLKVSDIKVYQMDKKA